MNYEIKKCIFKVKLFEPDKKPNRRLTPQEQADDLEIAKWLKRPVRYFFNDPPFYPWLPPEPIVPCVNFRLNYKE